MGAASGVRVVVLSSTGPVFSAGHDFRDFLTEYFAGSPAGEAIAAVDWDTWFNAPGMPPVANEFDQSLNAACSELVAKWAARAASGGYSMTFLLDRH